MARATVYIFAFLLVASCMSKGAPGASAQDCPFADSLAVPDTVAAQRYWPLTLGNEWHYEVHRAGLRERIRIEAVVGDTLVDENVFSKLAVTEYVYDIPVVEISLQGVDVLAVSDSGIVRSVSDSLIMDPSLLSADLWSCYPVDVGSGYAVVEPLINYGVTVVENGAVIVRSYPYAKQIYIPFFGQTIFVPDVGKVLSSTEDVTSRIVYASVSGHELGTRVDSLYVFAVGSEQWGHSPKLAIATYPNPVHTRLTVRVTPGGHDYTSISIFDALGRQRVVRNVEFDGSDFTIDIRSLPPGVHFLVLNANVGRARTASFVVIR